MSDALEGAISEALGNDGDMLVDYYVIAAFLNHAEDGSTTYRTMAPATSGWHSSRGLVAAAQAGLDREWAE